MQGSALAARARFVVRGASDRLRNFDVSLAVGCFATACAVGLVGAFVGLGTHGLWFDELFTTLILEPGSRFGDLVARIATDVHPPVYFVLLSAYADLVGDTDVVLRSFSALAAALAIVVFIVATRRAFSLPARLFGASLATGSLFWFFQAQNARSYALCLLISAGIVALCLGVLAERPRRGRDVPASLIGLIALSLVGSFTHFYLLYEGMAALAVIALLRPQWRHLALGAALALLIASCLYVELVVEPRSRVNLSSNWYRNDVTWYYQVLKSCVQYTLGEAGAVALLICGGVIVLWRRPLHRSPLDAVVVALAGVPLLVLAAAAASSTFLAPNFFDRNFLVVSPFLWGISAKLYDAATAATSRPARWGVNVALSALVLSMTWIVALRLPTQQALPLYEPFRESAEWLRSLPDCRDQVLPVVTTDRVAWYKPGYAEAVYGAAYGRYLRGFATPRLLFMEEILAREIPADLRAELQRRVDGEGCPVLAWAAHNVGRKNMATAEARLLQAIDRPSAQWAVKTQMFQDGQVGFVVYADRRSGD